MQRQLTRTIARAIQKGRSSSKTITITAERRIQYEVKRSVSQNLRCAVANELSSIRLTSALNGFELGIERGWDLVGDDDGG